MTINYIEKGCGLHRLIHAAGHVLEEKDGVWVSSDDVAVQHIIDSYTLDQAKVDKKQEVSNKAREKYDLVTAGISAAEMAGWPILVSEAIAFRSTGEIGPAIQLESSIRDVAVEDLVSKIERNAAAFQSVRSAIAGTDGRKRDEIDSLLSFEEVAAYDVYGGWPL